MQMTHQLQYKENREMLDITRVREKIEAHVHGLLNAYLAAR